MRGFGMIWLGCWLMGMLLVGCDHGAYSFVRLANEDRREVSHLEGVYEVVDFGFLELKEDEMPRPGRVRISRELKDDGSKSDAYRVEIEPPHRLAGQKAELEVFDVGGGVYFAAIRTKTTDDASPNESLSFTPFYYLRISALDESVSVLNLKRVKGEWIGENMGRFDLVGGEEGWEVPGLVGTRESLRNLLKAADTARAYAEEPLTLRRVAAP